MSRVRRWVSCLLLVGLAACGRDPEVPDGTPEVPIFERGPRIPLRVLGYGEGGSTIEKSVHAGAFDEILAESTDPDPFVEGLLDACRTEYRRGLGDDVPVDVDLEVLGNDTRLAFLDDCKFDPATGKGWPSLQAFGPLRREFARNALYAQCAAEHLLSFAETPRPVHMYRVCSEDDPHTCTGIDVFVSSASDPTAEFAPPVLREAALSGRVERMFTVPPQATVNREVAAATAATLATESLRWLSNALRYCPDGRLEGAPGELITTQLAEGVVLLEEASTLIERHGRASANLHRSEQRDETSGRILSRRDEESSRLRTAALYSPAPRRAFGLNGSYPVVTQLIDTREIHRAYQRLRTLGVNPFETGEALAIAHLEHSNCRYRSDGWVENGPGTFGSPVDEDGEPNVEDAMRFLSNLGLTQLHLDQAALALQQEAQAVGVHDTTKMESVDVGGCTHWVAVEQATRAGSWAVEQARTAGNNHYLYEPDLREGLTTKYMRSSLLGALDVVGEVLAEVRDRADIADVANRLDGVLGFIRTEVDDRARVSYVPGEEGKWTLHISFHNPEVHQFTGQASSSELEVWEGRAGLDCAVYGTIGRHPCPAELLESRRVPVDVSLIPALTPNRYSETNELADVRVQITDDTCDGCRGLQNGREIYVTRRVAGVRTALLGLTVRTPSYILLHDPPVFSEHDEFVIVNDAGPRDPERREGEAGRVTSRLQLVDASWSPPEGDGDIVTEDGRYTMYLPVGSRLRRALPAILGVPPDDPAEQSIEIEGVRYGDPVLLGDPITAQYGLTPDASIAYYLARAREAAARADDLGESAYNERLEIDRREEGLQAGMAEREQRIIDELTRLCGGFVDVSRIREACEGQYDDGPHPYFGARPQCDLAEFIQVLVADPSQIAEYGQLGFDLSGLRECLGAGRTLEPYALGQDPLCFYQETGLPPCVCADEDVCPDACPVIVPNTIAGGGDDDEDGVDDAKQTWCASRYTGFAMGSTTFVSGTLNLQFDDDFAPTTAPEPAHCIETVGLLRSSFEPGGGQPDVDTSWFTRDNVRRAVEGLGLDPSYDGLFRVRRGSSIVLEASHGSWPFAGHPLLAEAIGYETVLFSGDLQEKEEQIRSALEAVQLATGIAPGSNSYDWQTLYDHHDDGLTVSQWLFQRASAELIPMGSLVLAQNDFAPHQTIGWFGIGGHDAIHGAEWLQANSPHVWLAWDWNPTVLLADQEIASRDVNLRASDACTVSSADPSVHAICNQARAVACVLHETGEDADGDGFLSASERLHSCRVKVPSTLPHSIAKDWQGEDPAVPTKVWLPTDLVPGTEWASTGAIGRILRGESSPPTLTFAANGAEYSFTRSALLDGFEIACLSAAESRPSCAQYFEDPVAVASNMSGPQHMSYALQCYADRASQVLAEGYAVLPSDVAESLRSGGASVGDARGEYGAIVGQIADDILQVRSIAESIVAQSRLNEVAIAQVGNALDELDLQDQIFGVDMMASSVSSLASCAAGMAELIGVESALKPGKALAATINCANQVAQMAFAIKKNELQAALLDLEERGLILGLVEQTLTRADAISNLTIELQRVSASLEQGMLRLEALQNETKAALNLLRILDAEREGSPVVNSALAARAHTTQTRYEDALVLAKQAALRLVNAIDARYGDRMAWMHEIVGATSESPAAMLYRIESTTGINYDAIVTAAADSERFYANGGYADQFIEDLVEQIAQFATHDLPLAQPVSGGVTRLDVSIASLIGARPGECPMDQIGPSPNLLFDTNTMGSDDWTLANPAGIVPENPLLPLAARYLADASSSTLSQTVYLTAGSHVLSWRHVGSNNAAGGGHSVTITTAGDAPVEVEVADMGVLADSVAVGGSFASRRRYQIPADGLYTITWAPTSRNYVWIGRTMLQPGTEATAAFIVTDELPGNNGLPRTFDDECGFDGAGLTGGWRFGTEYFCPENTPLGCDSWEGVDPTGLPQRDYVERTFFIGADLAEIGASFTPVPDGAGGNETPPFPLGAHNHRFGKIGVYHDSSTGGLYYAGNTYALIHEGPYTVRNWWNDAVTVRHPRASANGAIGYAAPEANTFGSPAIESFMREELNGRPFSGALTLRVYDDPGAPGTLLQRAMNLRILLDLHYLYSQSAPPSP